MLATLSNKLSQMETTLKEHSKVLMELQTILQLDAGSGGSIPADVGSVIVVHRPDSTQTRHSTRLLAVRRLLTEIQQRADHADLQVETQIFVKNTTKFSHGINISLKMSTKILTKISDIHIELA